jgi:hypothetical protein
MSAVAGPETGPGKRRTSATTAFLLGLASPLLMVAGWVWGFLLFDLGLFAAVAAVPYGVRALRHGGAKLLAAVGLLLALLTLAVVVFFFVTFAINPPE